MIIAIPLKPANDYTELRFALRSIDKFLPGHEVVIIGTDLPHWINHVSCIQVADIPNRKQLSIKRKIAAALEYSEEIFFTNDDIYFLGPCEPENFPFYYAGLLNKSTESGGKALMSELQAQGKPIKHFDVHYPILYQRSKFGALSGFSSDSIIKSAYCNYHEIEGTPIQDAKIFQSLSYERIRALIKGKPCFSTATNMVQATMKLFLELYPGKSKFEI